MDLHHLEYIIALAEEEGISRAAKRLYISQPALSKSLAIMEKKLGTRLFYRERDKITPTSAGAIYIDAARKMLDIRNETMKKIAAMPQPSVSHRIRIGTNNSPFIAETTLLMANHPAEEIPIFYDADSVECQEMLLNGQLDISIFVFPDGIPDSMECLFSEEDSLVVIVPNTPEFSYINDHYSDTLPISVLNGAKAIQGRPESGLAIMAERYLQRNGVVLDYIYSISINSAILLSVENGIGVAITHKSCANEKAQYRIYTPDPPLTYHHVWCIQKGAEITPQMKKVLNIIWKLEL